MKFIKDSFFTLGTRFVFLVLGIVVSVIIARTLGPTGRGQWAQILLPVTLIHRLFIMDITVAQVYLVNKLGLNINKVVSTVVFLFIIISILCLCFYFSIISTLQRTFFQATPLLYFYLISIIIPLEIWLLITQYIFMIDRRINIINGLQLSKVCLLVLLLLVFTFFIDLNITTLIFIYISVLVITIIVGFFKLNKINISLRPGFQKKLAKPLLSFGLKSHIGQIFMLLSERVDLWFLSYFLSISEVGIYSVSLIAVRLIELPDAIGFNLFPYITKAGKESGAFKSQQVIRILIIISIILILFFAFSGKYLFNFLYGEKFAAAVIPFIILLPLVLLNSIAKNCRAYLSGNGLPQIASYANGSSLITNLCLGYFLIQEWGIIGAASTTILSVTVYTGIMLFYFLKVSKLSFLKTLLIQTEDITFILQSGKSLWKKYTS